MNAKDIDCESARVVLSRLHDGEEKVDDGGAGASLAKHLAVCCACRDFASKLSSSASLFDSMRVTEPPARVVEGLLAKAKWKKGRDFSSLESRPLRRARPWTLRAAAALIGFLLVSALGRMKGGAGEQNAAFPFDGFAQAGRAFLEASDLKLLPERELLLHVADRNGDSR